MRSCRKKIAARRDQTGFIFFFAYCIIIVSRHDCIGPDATYTSHPHHTLCQMSPTCTRHLQERDDQCE